MNHRYGGCSSADLELRFVHFHQLLIPLKTAVYRCLKKKGTLPETNIAPENRSSQKESSIPTIHFQGRAVSFREGTFLCFPGSSIFLIPTPTLVIGPPNRILASVRAFIFTVFSKRRYWTDLKCKASYDL